jgi:hypothetical protein
VSAIVFGNPDQTVNTRKRPTSALTAFVVGAFVFVLCAVLWYMVAKAQHSAYESICHSNLFKLRHALVTYDGNHGSLPPAATLGPDGHAAHSWRVLILPYLDPLGIDGDAIYAAYDMSQPWNAPRNLRLIKPVHNGRFACPCGSEDETILTSYVVITGEDTLFPEGRAVSASDVPDTVDPILVIEITNSDIQWSEPRDLSINNLESTRGVDSIELTRPHAGAIRYITLRGHLGVLLPATSPEAIRQLASPDGRLERSAEEPL